MNIMMKQMPDRVFDVGIAEGHAVTFAAGMAKDGLMPFCNIYSAFAQRAYDNIIHDAALQRLPVVLCLDRAGLVGEDGATHHGAFRHSGTAHVPNLTLASPMDECELAASCTRRNCPKKAPSSYVIRAEKGVRTDWKCPWRKWEGAPDAHCERATMWQYSATVRSETMCNAPSTSCNKEGNTISVAHYDLRFAKPLDTALLTTVAQRFSRIVTIEDGARGRRHRIGSARMDERPPLHTRTDTTRLPDNFVEHGTVAQLREIVGLDIESIKKAIKGD